MDDWVILSPSRWKLRKAVRIVNETLAELQVEQHPDKTFVGRVERGFTILGYAFPANEIKQKTKRQGSPVWPRRRLSGLPNVCISFMSKGHSRALMTTLGGG